MFLQADRPLKFLATLLACQGRIRSPVTVPFVGSEAVLGGRNMHANVTRDRSLLVPSAMFLPVGFVLEPL